MTLNLGGVFKVFFRTSSKKSDIPSPSILGYNSVFISPLDITYLANNPGRSQIINIISKYISNPHNTRISFLILGHIVLYISGGERVSAY